MHLCAVQKAYNRYRSRSRVSAARQALEPTESSRFRSLNRTIQPRPAGEWILSAPAHMHCLYICVCIRSDTLLPIQPSQEEREEEAKSRISPAICPLAPRPSTPFQTYYNVLRRTRGTKTFGVRGAMPCRCDPIWPSLSSGEEHEAKDESENGRLRFVGKEAIYIGKIRNREKPGERGEK